MIDKNILLQNNMWLELPSTQFFHATDGKLANQFTKVKLKSDGQFLNIEFNCEQNLFVNENNYFENNSEMWNQEVFEIFISPSKITPKRYLEIEINPNNALFVGWIKNETGQKPDSCDFISHNESGIIHGVQKKEAKWQGFLNIPFSLISNISNDYRINFYRIISKKSHSNLDWKCDQNDCDFTCYFSTMSGENPRFHVPDSFGFLKIK